MTIERDHLAIDHHRSGSTDIDDAQLASLRQRMAGAPCPFGLTGQRDRIGTGSG